MSRNPCRRLYAQEDQKQQAGQRSRKQKSSYKQTPLPRQSPNRENSYPSFHLSSETYPAQDGPIQNRSLILLLSFPQGGDKGLKFGADPVGLTVSGYPSTLVGFCLPPSPVQLTLPSRKSKDFRLGEPKPVELPVWVFPSSQVNHTQHTRRDATGMFQGVVTRFESRFKANPGADLGAKFKLAKGGAVTLDKAAEYQPAASRLLSLPCLPRLHAHLPLASAPAPLPAAGPSWLSSWHPPRQAPQAPENAKKGDFFQNFLHKCLVF